MTTEPTEPAPAPAAAAAEAAAAAGAASAEAAQKEAYQYWGYLIKPDKCGTDTLDRLLKGLAEVIVSASADAPSCAERGMMGY